MNLEQVSHYIAHPHELTLNEAPVLRELSEKHPYSAVFSLLYLTALANGKSVDLDAALQQHAYRLSDRTKLYHLVSAPLENLVEESASLLEGGPRGVTEISSSEETVEPEIAAEAEIAPEEAIPENMNRQIDEQIYSPVTPIERASEDIPSEEIEVTNIGVASSAAESVEENEEEAFTFITEAFTREQHFDLSETATHEEEVVPEHIPHEEIPEEMNVSVAEEPVISFDFSKEEELVEEPHIEEQEESSPLPPLQRGNEELPSTTEISTAAKSFTSWLKSAGEKRDVSASAEEKAVETAEKRSVDEIIDTFIKEEPTITRRKTEFYSPSVKAKESLDEEAMPVSETLAKIYAAQGNYPKAIHVYHQLMLSFPEKKSLFAVQIEALKKKITA
jgi:hypothetical protein